MTHDLLDFPFTSGPSDTLLARAQMVAAHVVAEAETLDRDGAFPTSAIAALHRAGLLHAPFPVTMGGCDLGGRSGDPACLADVLAAIGRGHLPLGRLYEGHVNAIKLVGLYGSPENLLLLKAEADAGHLSGVWMAEDGDPLQLVRQGSGARLRGRKILASGACHIRRPLVAAAEGEGRQMLLPRIPPGDRVDLSGWTATGMKASATGAVNFTGIAITAEEIVGEPDDYVRSPYFRGGAWRVMAVQLGGLQALLDSYRLQMTQSGRATDRLQRARFGQAVAAVEGARLWIREAARCAEEGLGDPAAIDAYVDLMRGAFEEAALLVIERAQKSLGLKAFLRPNPVERIVRDLTTYLRQPALDASLDAAAAFFFDHSFAWDDQ